MEDIAEIWNLTTIALQSLSFLCNLWYSLLHLIAFRSRHVLPCKHSAEKTKRETKTNTNTNARNNNNHNRERNQLAKKQTHFHTISLSSAHGLRICRLSVPPPFVLLDDSVTSVTHDYDAAWVTMTIDMIQWQSLVNGKWWTAAANAKKGACDKLQSLLNTLQKTAHWRVVANWHDLLMIGRW